MGILQARTLEWVAMPSSRGLSNPGIELRYPTMQADSLPSESPGKSVWSFYILSNKSLPTQIYTTFSCVFFWNFYRLRFLSRIHFNLTFGFGGKWKNITFFSHFECLIVPKLLKRLYFPHWINLAPLLIIDWACVCRSTSELFIQFPGSVFLFFCLYSAIQIIVAS